MKIKVSNINKIIESLSFNNICYIAENTYITIGLYGVYKIETRIGGVFKLVGKYNNIDEALIGLQDYINTNK
ncbi:MAG: hypothetical protein ACRC5T_10315 [Cetobacterium sp.]